MLHCSPITVFVDHTRFFLPFLKKQLLLTSNYVILVGPWVVALSPLPIAMRGLSLASHFTLSSFPSDKVGEGEPVTQARPIKVL